MEKGERIRLVTRDRFHNRTGTVVREAHVLPGRLWLVVAVDPRKDEVPFLLYVGLDEVIPIAEKAPRYNHFAGSGASWTNNRKRKDPLP